MEYQDLNLRPQTEDLPIILSVPVESTHGGLKIAADLPMREELLIELESFQTRASASGVQVLDGGRADNHADMAVSLAIGWFASEQLGGFVGEGQLENWF